MNRRQFLQPALMPTAAQLLGLAQELSGMEQELQQSSAPALIRFARRAMAATFEVILPFGTAASSSHAAAALDTIDRLEGQLSAYQQESEVCRLNRLAALAPVQVAENLFQLLARAEGLHRATTGAFDIAVGALIKAWGFFHRQGRVPGPEELAAALACSGQQHMVLEADRRQVHFLRPGLEINLGGIGKGYALDRAMSILRAHQVANAMIHGGHSSIVARGHEPGGRRGWAVGIRHPLAQGRSLGVWHLRDQALGTSAATFQHLQYNGRRLGHIIDPRSGWPAEGLLGSTVAAATATEADALATAFFVLGVDGAQAYCQAHPDIGAVLLPNLPGSQPVVLGTAGQDFHLDP